ncbi:MAG: transposase [Candidatus Bathyarchaeota archaeon]|nr:transposase [Candidatus Bathyarchaeota archaeon]
MKDKEAEEASLSIFKKKIEDQLDVSNANGSELNLAKQLNQELKEEKKKTKLVEKDLIRKEKTLAEAGSLLLLRKKAQTIWGDQEDE